jgi:Fur family ferric uptake transcriptional regulator
METADIKNAGLKVTLPRMKILELLESSNDRHLKAEDIYKMLLDSGEEIALATVYRVLTQFETKYNFTISEHTMVLYGHFNDQE